jgi:hypothetical protein
LLSGSAKAVKTVSMTACENNLFIQFNNSEIKDYFLKVFENVDNQLLFQSFMNEWI